MIFKTGTTGLINLGDSLFPFFPQEKFERLLYLWDSHITLGQDNSATVPQLPWYGIVALLDRLGVPLWAINRLWFALPFLLLGFSMYFLSGAIFGKDKKFSRFISTLFFMFNPFTISICSGSNILTFSFAGGVFVFGLFVSGLQKSKLDIKNILLIGLVSIFATTSTVVWVMTVFLCAAYFLFFLVANRTNKQRLIRSLKFLLFAFCFLLLVNSWWLLPFLYQLSNPGYFNILFAAGTDVGTLKFMAEHTPLFDVSRLFYGITPAYYFPISNYYHYLLSPTVMTVLVLLIFSVSLFKKKSRSEVFFLLLAWVSVILASGTRPPFGFVYQFLWNHIPYFHIFRTTNRFNLWTMISYAILLGFLYQRIKEFLERHHRRSLIPYSLFLILVSILLSSWPLLSGDIYGQLKPHHISQDYYDLREFLKNQEGDFRVMSFPRADWLVAYSWSAPFDMQEILTDFSPKDTVINPVGHFQDLKDRQLTKDDPLYIVVYALLEEGPQKLWGLLPWRFSLDANVHILKNLQLLRVRYLVLHRDYVHVYKDYPAVYTEPLEDTLKAVEGINFVRPFGDLDVYEVEDVQPRIYSTDGNLIYRKISPVEYKIAVKDVETPYTLVFGENFNRGWRLDGNEPSGGLTRGFGNVWQVDKTGDYELRLSYWPQRLLEIGFLISALSLVSGAVVLIFKRK